MTAIAGRRLPPCRAALGAGLTLGLAIAAAQGAEPSKLFIYEPAALAEAVPSVERLAPWPGTFARAETGVVATGQADLGGGRPPALVVFGAAGEPARISFSYYETPAAARAAFESLPGLRTGDPAGAAPLAWLERDLAGPQIELLIACGHSPLGQETPPDAVLCAAHDGRDQVVVQTLVTGPVDSYERLDEIVDVSLETLDQALTAHAQAALSLRLQGLGREATPEEVAWVDEAKMVQGRYPATLVDAIKDPAFLDEVEAALRRSDAVHTPFGPPTEAVSSPATRNWRDGGLYAIAALAMDDDSAYSGVEVFIYHDHADSDRNFEAILVPREALDDQGGWDMTTKLHTVEPSAGGGKREVLCGWAKFGEVRARAEFRCAYLPIYAPLVIVSYSRAPEPLDQDTLLVRAAWGALVLDVVGQEIERLAAQPAVPLSQRFRQDEEETGADEQQTGTGESGQTGEPAAGSLLGLWLLPGVGTMEFKADGSYIFANPVHGHAGTYQAADGNWSLKAQTRLYEDGGTYRLLDPNTLELAGRLGVGVWTRLR